MGTAGGITKVLEKIKATVESGSSYEAQQMYKTVYYRFRSKKQIQDSYQILKEGAILQLSRGQATCGVELGLLLIEAYKQDSVAASGTALSSVCDVVRALPATHHVSLSSGPSSQQAGDSSSSTPTESVVIDEFARFVGAAVKWAGGKTHTSPAPRQIHDLFAQYLWDTCGMNQLGRAALHFARGHDAKAYAKVLASAMEKGKQEEGDMFVAHAVLQVLATGHRASAGAQWAHAKALLAACQDLRPQDTPLTNLLTLLLQALHLKSLPLFMLLRDRYQAALALDPAYSPMLERIESVYLRPRGGGGFGGPLGGLLGSLLGGDMLGEMGDDLAEVEDEDEEEHYSDLE